MISKQTIAQLFQIELYELWFGDEINLLVFEIVSINQVIGRILDT